jgi:hypothetical protein
MHLFDLSTSKKGPRLSVFNTFHLEMCFALQRRALFQRLNFQKCSAPKVFLTCWLPNALRATAACTFSISPLPKVVRALEAFDILTSTCAPRHTCIQFLISHLRTCRFSEPTLRTSGATKHWKNTVFRDFFYLFANLDLLTTDSFSSDWFSSLTALTTVSASVHQSEVWLLNFLR